MAQPRISKQPSNVAVLLGQNARFRVGVLTDGTLAYQWRFNGTPLGDLAIRWPRGSVPSQLEWTPDLLSGQWQPLGKPNSLSETTMKRASSQGFFRVLFLGQ